MDRANDGERQRSKRMGIEDESHSLVVCVCCNQSGISIGIVAERYNFPGNL